MKIENKKIVDLDPNTDTNLVIPADVEAIDLEIFEVEYHGFFGLLESITVEEGNKNFYVKNNCLMDTDGVLYFAAQGATIPTDGSVKAIRPFACNMISSINGEVRIPDGVEGIDGSLAFGSSDYNRIYIPASVKKIGEAAFGPRVNLDNETYEEKPYEIIVDSNNERYFAQDGCLIDSKTSAVVSVFGSEVIIPSCVKRIGSSVFVMKSFDKVIIPASVTEIGEPDFTLCKANFVVEKDSFAEKYLVSRKIDCSVTE